MTDECRKEYDATFHGPLRLATEAHSIPCPLLLQHRPNVIMTQQREDTYRIPGQSQAAVARRPFKGIWLQHCAHKPEAPQHGR